VRSETDLPNKSTAFTDDYLLYLLAQASAAASQAFHAELAKDGIPVSTWRILSSLYPDIRLNVGALAEQSLLKQPTLTRTLDRLTTSELVRRVHSAADRRGVLVELTQKGRSLAGDKIEKARTHEALILKNHSTSEITALKAMLRTLRLSSSTPAQTDPL
jgi:DNA-binding MarR family transcriptional regulator